MKKAGILMLSLLIAVLCMAQTVSWKQFIAFHATVSKVLHPLITGNVKPVKYSSAELLAKAKAWQSSPIPKGIDAAVFTAQIAVLVKQCSDLNEAVKSKQPDAVLITKANTVHEIFHAVLKACNLKD